MAFLPEACADGCTLLLYHGSLVCYCLCGSHIPNELLHCICSVFSLQLGPRCLAYRKSLWWPLGPHPSSVWAVSRKAPDDDCGRFLSSVGRRVRAEGAFAICQYGWLIVEEVGHGLHRERAVVVPGVSGAASLLPRLTRVAADVTGIASAPSTLFGHHGRASLLL